MVAGMLHTLATRLKVAMIGKQSPPSPERLMKQGALCDPEVLEEQEPPYPLALQISQRSFIVGFPSHSLFLKDVKTPHLFPFQIFFFLLLDVKRMDSHSPPAE